MLAGLSRIRKGEPDKGLFEAGQLRWHGIHDGYVRFDDPRVLARLSRSPSARHQEIDHIPRNEAQFAIVVRCGSTVVATRLKGGAVR